MVDGGFILSLIVLGQTTQTVLIGMTSISGEDLTHLWLQMHQSNFFQGDSQPDLCDWSFHLRPLPPDSLLHLQSLFQPMVCSSQDSQQPLPVPPGLQPLLGGVALRGPCRASGM